MSFNCRDYVSNLIVFIFEKKDRLDDNSCFVGFQ